MNGVITRIEKVVKEMEQSGPPPCGTKGERLVLKKLVLVKRWDVKPGTVNQNCER